MQILLTRLIDYDYYSAQWKYHYAHETLIFNTMSIMCVYVCMYIYFFMLRNIDAVIIDPSINKTIGSIAVKLL